MGEVLEHPLAAARRAEREEALLSYATLVAYVEELAAKWGRLTPTAVCVQLRLARMLWLGLNSALKNGWIEAEPAWEALRRRFTAVTEGAAPPHRQPGYREAHSLIVVWELRHGPLPLLRQAALNLL
jgi:hypothetical protein